MKLTNGLCALVLGLVLVDSGWAQATQRISVASGGTQGNANSNGAAISADGLTVAFGSEAFNLVGGDGNAAFDVFFRRWAIGQTGLVSADSSGTLGDDTSFDPSISADGRYLAFNSIAGNLVAGDTNGAYDVFVRDRVLGTTQRVSLSSGGVQGNGLSTMPSISADGRYVAFQSSATNLVPGDTNGGADIFVRDRLSGVTERVSVSSSEAQAGGGSAFPSISADGRYVAFDSDAANLVAGDTNGFRDVFVRDRVAGVTVIASVNSSEWSGNNHSVEPSISADGLFVAFTSQASNMVDVFILDLNGASDVFVRDLSNGTTAILSVSSGSVIGNAGSKAASISADGRFVAFDSTATNLVAGDTNGERDVFVRDRLAFTTERVSRASGGAQGNDSSNTPSISGDGRFVAFASDADNLVAGDTNDFQDVFVHDREASGFTSVCHPGVDGVIGCPCGNPPAAVGRGCENSSATGGAFLTASGQAYLAADSLVLTTFAEKPTALSIVLQGSATIPAGVVYGQGVRCVGGSLVRLYTRNAVSGSVSVPAAGDPSVSAQSAAKGDTIPPGQTRWYLVYYRDGNVLGGCPATSKFNATQTGRITWMP